MPWALEVTAQESQLKSPRCSAFFRRSSGEKLEKVSTQNRQLESEDDRQRKRSTAFQTIINGANRTRNGVQDPVRLQRWVVLANTV